MKGTFAITGMGTINLAGSFLAPAKNVLAVVRGTGLYQDVRGQARIASGGPDSVGHTTCPGDDTDFTLSLLP